MSTPSARLGATHLFSGPLTLGNDGQLVPEPQGLQALQEVVLLTANVAVGGEPQLLTPWKTDATGRLYPLPGTGTQRKTVPNLHGPRSFHLAPPSVLLDAWVTGRDKWAEELQKLLAAGGTLGPGVTLSETRVRKKHLRAPDRESKGDAEKAYAEWYDTLGDDSWISGYVLPRVRAALLVFTDRHLDSARVTVKPEKGGKAQTLRVSAGPGLTYALLTGTRDELPEGLYTLEVRARDALDAERWSGAARKAGGYALREMIRFNITNFAGEFDVVLCDPISVEEAVMVQFPGHYAHLAAAAKQRTLYPDLQFEASFKEFPDALTAWSERLAWTHSKAKLAVNLINADGTHARAKKLGKALWDGFAPTDPLLKSAKEAIDLAFGVHSTLDDLGSLMSKLRAERDLKDLKRLLWNDLDTRWNFYRWWGYVTREYAEGDIVKVLDLASAPAAERAAVLAAGVPQKRTKLQELLGDGKGAKVEKALTAVSTALDVYNVAVAFNEVLGKEKDLEKLKGDFTKLLRQVDSVLARGASREGLGTLERMRSATVAAHQGLQDAEAKALMAAFDLVLGLLVMVGTGGAGLELFVLAKGAVDMGQKAFMDASEWFDRVALKGFVKDAYARQWTLRANHARAVHSNQALMPSVGPDGGEKDLHVQFRLRAEALNGLVGLLLRAGVASKTPEAYLERVRAYRVAEYVRHFVLGDGWQHPVRPAVPIGMDAAWLRVIGPKGGAGSEEQVSEQLGFTRPLTAAAAHAVPGAITMLAALDSVLAGNAVARFQGTFPVHRMEASSVESLAQAFRMSWQELGPDAVESTCVYKRPAGSAADAPWMLVNAKGAKSVDELELLSPFDQIRVLVVLKKDVKEGIYPVSFQLERVDGVFNLDGPVYKDYLRRLGEADLLPEERARNLAGRLGCVFYPFYQLGPAGFVPGLKPLATRAADLAGVWLYYFSGALDDMRYALKLRLGDSASGAYVTLGGPNGTKSELDEVRMSVRNSGHERKLINADFLRRESETFQYPLLFQLSRGAGAVYARVGAGPFKLASPEQGAVQAFEHFTWSEPVEFVVVAWSMGLATDHYVEADIDWTRIPCAVELHNRELVGLNDKGPQYPSTLQYLGKLAPGGAALVPGPKAVDGPLAKWFDQVRANPAELAQLARAVAPRTGGDKHDYHLYAAHFALSYVTPNGTKVNSLRPFGEVLDGSSHDFYRIVLRNFSAAAGTNLAEDTLVAPLSSSWTSLAKVSHPEYEFHFAAPKKHHVHPWNGLSEETVKRWIVDEATHRNPSVELLKTSTD